MADDISPSTTVVATSDHVSSELSRAAKEHYDSEAM